MHIETQCLHEGYKPGNGDPKALPIYQSTTYTYDSTDHIGQLFDLTADGHMYSRISNPTVAAVEEKIAAMEGGVGALCTTSGQAANLLAVLNICTAGDHFVTTSTIYGGTVNLFAVTLKKFGIDCTFVDADAPVEELQKAFRPNTKLVFGETIANPAISVFDIEKFAKLAHANGVPLIVDNTFATPVLCRPFEWGADIVTHSTTKYMDGHAVQVGGVIVDSGRFDWENGKFEELCQPDESYHGITYTKQFGKAAYITKARVQLMRDFLDQSGPGDAGSSDGTPLPQRGKSGAVPGRAAAGGVCQLSHSGRRQIPCGGAEISAEWLLGRDFFLTERRPGSGGEVDGQPAAGQQRGACGRHLHLRSASGLRNAPSADGQPAGGGGHHSGPDSSVRGMRACG